MTPNVRHDDALMFERNVIVSFDDAGVTARYPNGDIRTIEWSSVLRVAIETNDTGPWDADVWWMLEGSEMQITYPQGATGDSEMLGQYSVRFPGFNDQQVIKAMCCADLARFVCWERS